MIPNNGHPIKLEINLPTADAFMEMVSIVGNRQSGAAGDVIWYTYPARGKNRLLTVIRLCGLEFIDQGHTISVMNTHGGMGMPF